MQTMPNDNYRAEVYISYAGNDPGDKLEGSRDEIVKHLCEQLGTHNLLAREYKRDIGYKNSIGDFMDDIAGADYIILLISDKYLRSEYCMYEATELLSKHRKDLLDKVFPVLLADAKLAENKTQVEYIKYWISKYEEHKKLIEGMPPEYTRGLTDISIRYREIGENINDLVTKIMDVKQISQNQVDARDYSVVVEAILNAVEKNQKGNVSAQIIPVSVQSQAVPAIYQQMPQPGSDVAQATKEVNNFLSNVIARFDDTIFDSEKAKKIFLDVNFDDISAAGTMSPLSRDLVSKIRTGTEKFENYRRSLIISALSLGLIKKYDEEKARMLIDFVNDGEPGLWHRSLVGLIIGLMDKEDFISDEIARRLKKLQNDQEVQDCLVMIFFYVGNSVELERILGSLNKIDYNKFEFFKQTQHWFLPFFENNPILKENIPNKKFAQSLLQANLLFGLDSSKYAIALLYPSLEKDAMGGLDQLFDLDKAMINALQTEESKKSYLLQTEVLKYLLEFYLYGLHDKNSTLTALIEDKKMLRKGKIFELLTHPHYKIRLRANELFSEQKYTEAVDILKPILEDDPGNKQVLFLSGLCYYLAEKTDEAIPLFEKSVQKGNKETVVFAYLGDAYYSLKNYEKAIENYELLLTTQENVSALVNIGTCYQLKENPDPGKAFACFSQVEKLDPDNYINLLSLGDHYYNLKPRDVNSSYNYYLKAFDINPNNLSLVKALDELAFDVENKDPIKQVSIYKKYAELDPNSIRPYLLLGACYQDMLPPDNEASFKAYEKAFELEPDSALTNLYMGEIYQKIEKPDFEKALQHLQKAIELEKENKQALFFAGWASFMLGRYHDAENYFMPCLDSENADVVNQNLGHLALINKDETKAKAYYKAAYDLFKDKDYFKTSTMSDFEYLQKAGIEKDKFSSLVDEVVNGK